MAPTTMAHGGHDNIPTDDDDIDFFEDSSADGVDVPIPMYHSVGDAAYSLWWITTGLFTKQMDALVAYGYDTVSFADFLAYRNGTATPPDKPIILTFDDGYQNFYLNARPVLKTRGMTATLFLSTKYIGANEQVRQDNIWNNTAYDVKPTNHLVWQPEVIDLYNEGFSIESHAYSHVKLGDLYYEEDGPAKVLAELIQSRDDIRSYLGNNSANYFCYPYGHGTQDVNIHQLIEQAGYQVGVAAYPYKVANTLQHNIWQLPRLHIYEEIDVELDIDNPNKFFMKVIDPAFAIPDATVQAVEVQQVTGVTTTGADPGDTIEVTVRVKNNGDSTKLQTIIKLDDDTNHATFYFEGAQTKQVDSGQSKEFIFQLKIPDNTKPGDHYIKIDIVDEHSVLGFKRENWQIAFSGTKPAIADFSAAPPNGPAPLVVKFTNTSTGDFDTCLWNFGDGSTSTACNDPSHTYGQGGQYTVTLTVSGAGGENTKTKSNYITVYGPPTADFAANPKSGPAPLVVKFTNTSAGDFDTCLWNFGDDTTSTACNNPSHTYGHKGQYTVTLTVSGIGGENTKTKGNYITLYNPPTADFAATPIHGVSPLLVQFSDLSSGDYNTCLWDFGDGATSTVCAAPTHTYSGAGVYSASLQVQGSGGEDKATKSDYITVTTAAVADFSAVPTSGPPPLAVQFSNTSTGDFGTCFWNFGDGTTSTACNEPGHTYDQEGQYTVSLTVSGAGGENTKMVEAHITVAYYRSFLPVAAYP